MVQTKKGGETLRKTMIKKYGGEEAWKAVMRENGRKGGSVSTPTGGFAADNVRARTAGSMGGKYGHKGYKLIKRTETSGTYRRLSDGSIVEIKYGVK